MKQHIFTEIIYTPDRPILVGYKNIVSVHKNKSACYVLFL